MKKLIIFIFLNISFQIITLSQQQIEELTDKIIPPSPTAASLGKFGDIPVSLSTGIPNISLPVWEIREGTISVPITLAYHASGLKVEEIPGWVGLGWALNAGGISEIFRRRWDIEVFFRFVKQELNLSNLVSYN